MNWNQLQYVITIAEEKSITKAAQKLYISQPSLSLSIQALEKETGTPLFERNRGEMKLTYAGALFYEWAVSTPTLIPSWNGSLVISFPVPGH